MKLADGLVAVPHEVCSFVYWIIAKSTAGDPLGAERLTTAAPPLEDPDSHNLALTAEFQGLLNNCWPGAHWVMLDPHRYAVFRADTGVVGTLSLSTSAGGFTS